MALGARDVLAGPILRRVEPKRITVWVALRTPAPVTLQIWDRKEPGGTQLGTGEGVVVRVGGGLTIVTATAVLANALVPEAVYGYDVVIDGQTLGDLGLLAEGEIDGHRHVPLGYEVGHRPSFALPPRDITQLVTAHTSCRLLYSTGHDAMVSLDRLISDARNDWQRRPHQLFLTGDQIYADNVAPEMLRWLTSVGGGLISGPSTAGLWDKTTIERLRVDVDAEPDDDRETVARFRADELHFPAGRRTYLATLAAGLTSQDGTSHVMSLGEYCALYLFGWSNVLWPLMTEEWFGFHQARKTNVEAYLAALTAQLDARDQAVIAKRAVNDRYEPSGEIDRRVQHEVGWLLVPPRLRAIDRFLRPWAPGAREPDLVEIWDSKHAASDEQVKDPYHQVWVASATADTAVPRRAPPRSDVPPRPEDVQDKVPAGAFAGEDPAQLRALARRLTPSWFAGPTHFGLTYDVPDVPATFGQREPIVLYGDAVLERLKAMRDIYHGLPFVRRALANVPTYMMFDDHEISDDWNITRDWVETVRSKSLGRDVLRNGLTAYMLFQDLGNDPVRYATPDTPHAKALDAIRGLFHDGDALVEDGPRAAAVDELERRFGITKLEPGGLPVESVDDDERVYWHYRVDGPGYEVLVLDNRTARGYEARDSVPANLSAQAIARQIPRDPPPGDSDAHVTFVVAPVPVFGFPAIEQIGQPIINLKQQIRDDARTRDIDPYPPLQRAYNFGRLLRDPEHWGMTPPAHERLLARLANRRRVLFLSGDVHYSLTMKATYWQLDPTGQPRRDISGRVISTRFVQLTSSAALKEEDAVLKMAAHMGLAQQLGVVLSGPFPKLAWRPPPLSPVIGGHPEDDSLPPPVTGQWPDPWLCPPAGHKFPPLVYRRMTEDPAVIPLVALPAGSCTAVPPQWAWTVEMMKDERPDAIRLDGLAVPPMPLDDDLEAQPAASIRAIAERQFWQARHAVTRSLWLSANICTIRIRDREEAPGRLRREVVHTVWAHDPRDELFDVPRPYIEHVIPLVPVDPSDPGVLDTDDPTLDRIPTLPRCV